MNPFGRFMGMATGFYAGEVTAEVQDANGISLSFAIR
jgi:hypothetical protein